MKMLTSHQDRDMRHCLDWRAGLSAAALAAVMFALPASVKAAERRVAFVVGNSHYTVVPQLNNPDKDAQAVAAALKREGFEVVSALDLDRNEFDKALQRFIRSLPGAELSVFYYSGHGIQVGALLLDQVTLGVKSSQGILHLFDLRFKLTHRFRRPFGVKNFVHLDSQQAGACRTGCGGAYRILVQLQRKIGDFQGMQPGLERSRPAALQTGPVRIDGSSDQLSRDNGHLKLLTS